MKISLVLLVILIALVILHEVDAKKGKGKGSKPKGSRDSSNSSRKGSKSSSESSSDSSSDGSKPKKSKSRPKPHSRCSSSDETIPESEASSQSPDPSPCAAIETFLSNGLILRSNRSNFTAINRFLDTSAFPASGLGFDLPDLLNTSLAFDLSFHDASIARFLAALNDTPEFADFNRNLTNFLASAKHF